MTIAIKTRAELESKDFWEPRYRITPFRSEGMYPRGTFASKTGLFHADDEVVFAATYCETWRGKEDLPYSEVDWMLPELVRLLGSLMFCEQFPEGKRCWFYPIVHAELILANEQLDLCSGQVAQELKALVAKEPLFTSPSRAGAHNQGLIGNGYLFEPQGELDITKRDDYWASIQSSNRLVMRGIQALVKCDMLALHPEFQEEAAILSFIALDAAFELVLRHLKQLGVAKPSSADAADWFHQTFDGPLGFQQPADRNFFSDFYPQRIQTFHPGSRYGDSPFAAIAIDDRIHLRQTLPGLFAYLVCGVHSPHYLEKLKAYRCGTN